MVFPVVMYGCESWTMKKAESWRIDAFELWYWKTLLRVPWTSRRSSPWKTFVSWNSPGKSTPSRGSPSREYPPPGDLPNPGVKPRSPALQADSLPSELPATTLRFILKEWYFLKTLILLFTLLSWLTWVSSNIWRDAK